LGKGALMLMPVFMVVRVMSGMFRMSVLVRMGMGVGMRMGVAVIVGSMMLVGVLMFVFQVNVELGSRDRTFMTAPGVQVIPIQMQLGQFLVEPGKINSQIKKGSNEHVPADTAEKIEIESFHLESRPWDHSAAASALIWLAA
jgi:hypothetical protein